MGLVGVRWDTDNGSYDCVDLVKKYFLDVGNKQAVSVEFAYNYANSGYDHALPDGWTRMYVKDGYIPSPGDVTVWDAYVAGKASTGHVALIYNVHQRDDGTWLFDYVEQDTLAQKAAETIQDCSVNEPTCYIHPDFDMDFPAISDSGQVYPTSNGFTLIVSATDNIGIVSAEAKIWHYGQDDNDATTLFGTISSEDVRFSVDIDDFDGFVGNYYAVVTVADAGGNNTTLDLSDEKISIHPIKPDTGTYQLIKDSPVREEPYAQINGKNTELYGLVENTKVSVIGSYVNSHGNLWY